MIGLRAFGQGIASDGGAGLSTEEQRLYHLDRDKALSLRKAMAARKAVDLKAVEALGDELDRKWSGLNREGHARLLLEICEPLGSGKIKDKRAYDVARHYALSALAKPDRIPPRLELELVGHVMTPMAGVTNAMGTNEFSRARRVDTQTWLHAWRRLNSALDPAWYPGKPINGPSSVMPPDGLPISFGGMSPDDVKDPKLRAEYAAAIQKNRRELEAYFEQSQLHDWMKRYPECATEFIVYIYSRPPYDPEELRQTLDAYLTDKEAKSQILDAVRKNIAAQTRDTSADDRLVKEVNRLLSRFRDVCWRGDKGALKEMMSPDQVSFYLEKIASLDKSGAPCDFNMSVDNRPLVVSNNLVFASVCVTVMNSREEVVKTQGRALLTLRREDPKLMLIGTRYPEPGE
jgi:hypothetical protein